ncbi:MAG: hypothetical protein KIH62_001965 [Candidatus Kerfeldbacteria bacterium]|nr:hypothetical protein [Candidatus Kerfeldbacteria bacterium]
MQQTREYERGIFEPEPESSSTHLPMLVVPAAWYGVFKSIA